jgi:D-alanyl-D-alanine carboxypeptidase
MSPTWAGISALAGYVTESFGRPRIFVDLDVMSFSQ